ncbi:MAG: PQQ-dependent sugar dehydrogenase [Betaproteobacteria bacterium]
MTSQSGSHQVARVRNAIAGALLFAISTGIAAAERIIATDDYKVRVVTIASGLDTPWGMAFMDGGRMLVTEKAGRLRVIEGGKLLPQPVAGLPPVRVQGQGGLLDVSLHPDFARNQFIYWSYAGGSNSSEVGTEVARGRLSGDAAAGYKLENVEVIFRQQPKASGGVHFGSRLVWDRTGNLFVTMGERGQMQEAQNLGKHLGKIVRLTDRGQVPADNPFANKPGVLPEIFSYGHRNVQGAALHPVTGELWAHEHGPQGGDEVNIIRAGRNYGWPVITYGANYGTGTKIGEGTEKAGMEQPLWKWVPSIAPSGMAFYTGDKFPKWKGSLFAGALAGQLIVRLTLDGNTIVREERIKGTGRTRDVRAGPDGFLYVLSEAEGALLRFEPAQ